MNDGWIRNWSPGIGDPSFTGWLTVLLYFVAAFVVWRLVGARRASFSRQELLFWRALMFGLIALGINKQFDLQTAFTELGRMLATEQGWYGSRRAVQQLFILAAAVACVVASVYVARLVRRTPAPTKLALLGTGSLLLFIVVRASSFHGVDWFLGQTTAGLRWNWILEIGGISIILLAARWRRRDGRR